MKDVLDKLLTVKSIVTIALTAVFCALSVTGAVSGEQFLTIFTVVIGFYFGTQHEKKKPATETDQIPEAVPVEVAALKEANTDETV